MPTPMTIEMENEMTKDETQLALDQCPKDGNYTTEYLLEWFYHHQKTVIAALEAQLTKSDKNVTCGGVSNVDDTSAPHVKADVVEIPEGFRMSPEQNIVWDWAAAHGLTLVADECNDLLWRLENYNITRRTK